MSFSARRVLVLGGTGDIGSAIASRLTLDYEDEVIAASSKDLNLADAHSVDYFLDSCAVTHFNGFHTNKINNQGWKDIAEQVYRVLKPGGKFIIVSDVDINNEFGEFIKPELVIKLIESSGLNLIGTCDYSEPDPFTIHCGEYTLQVSNFIFEK